MPLFQAIILALVQALTEFLPVSSTAHLILFPWLLHWADPGEAFDVALHAGTLLAVALYFFKDWLTLIICGLGGKYPANAPAQEVAQHKRLFWYMIVGTIPGAILGKLFDKQIEEHLRLPGIIGMSMVLIALVMWWADAKAKQQRTVEQSNLGDAIAIGSAQAVALWPGVSRSGITITAGLFRNFTREAADRRRRRRQDACTDQAAQSRRPRPSPIDASHQRRRLRRCRLLRDRLFSQVFADTHAETIYCLPPGVWYHRVDSVPSSGSAIAPTVPSPLSAFPNR
jgi:undecaprenyl-diphosphatase UppP